MKKYQQYSINFLSLEGITTDIPNEFARQHYADLRRRGIQKIFFTTEDSLYRSPESASWQFEVVHRIEKDLYPDKFDLIDVKKPIPIYSLLVFDFAGKTGTEEEIETVLGCLNYGIIVQKKDGSYDIYERYMRSSSKLRAGGALMVKKGYAEQLRNIFSLGLIGKQKELALKQVEDSIVGEVIANQIKVIPSKWESHLTLCLTNSHAIPLDKKPIIRIVPDMKRIVEIKYKGLQKCDYKENEKYVGLEETYYETLSNDENDIQFKIEEGIRPQKIETIDGCGVASFKFFDKMSKALELSSEEIKHFVLGQIRAPFIKGTISKYSISEFCDEFNIQSLVDIYGNEFNPRDCDLILPESMFKGSSYFKTWEEYQDALETKYDFGGKAYDLFPNNEIIRVANLNKVKNPYREMTYQYLQSTINLRPNDLCVLADRLINDLVKGVTTNIGLAKKFLGLISKSNYENAMVSKAQGLLELHPAMFNSSLVQDVIHDTIETAYWDMRTGRIPLRGSYHYIVGDLSLLFINTPEFVSKSKKNILTDEDFCILGNGENYLAGHEGTTSVLHRSPQIHPSETRKVSFLAKGKNALADKYFGHLDGVIIFNSFETTALCMGGASL